ncbi:MAG: hypothetical protein CMN05_11930 [Roseibacillus sp.]|jgi:hypothetical protein|nr:hypothetical protein [Roseibacillus sp.]MBP34403.1 hypothetical protein [Roseibacillus sp.]MCP4729484.1 hypothetical protein [Roseibacillus sp.]MDP7307320.1 hypothetical protein [Roseibacillus sp.]|tara:strand:- start:7942 stop:10887 length:2946 start_codon:yes stop_codon:yes gene_type:complete
MAAFCGCATISEAGELPNLARKAKVSASSEFSADYLARWAVDGRIPALESKMDSRQAWCVRGKDGFRGEFTLEWKEPVEVAEIVYFGRTGQIVQECFKDYEIYLDDASAPAGKGVFEMRHGPQRIPVPKSTVRKIRLVFLSAHEGAINPGASEIAVFGAVPDDRQLADLILPGEERTAESRVLRDDLLAGRMGFRDLLLVKRHPLNISHVYVYHVEGYRPGGGLYVYRPDRDGGELRCILDSSKGMIVSADLSYDGREVVFSWKKGGLERCNPVALNEDIDRTVPDNNYQIYRVNIDGTGLKQLTSERSNNLDPCWLPDGGIAFISDRKPAYAYCYVVTSPVVYRMERDGSKQKRLSANYLMDFTPSVLNDGRIIYTRWEYVDRAACPIQSLWTINPDGTGLTGFYGNRVISPGTFMDAQPVPGTNTILSTVANHNGSCRGGIVQIDPFKGANSREAVRNLTPEVNIYAHRIGGGPWGNGMLDMRVGGTYEKPFPIDENRFLVSKGGAVQVRDFEANAATLLHPQEGMGFYCAQPIRGTPRPPVLGAEPGDRLAALPADGSVSGSWATVFMQDVYNGLEPDVKRGEIKQIAVVQELEKSTYTPQNNHKLDGPGMRNIAVFGFQFPLVSCGATYAPKKVWGFADVDKDGSSAFKVPSEVPIYFMALDKEGRALQRMRTFTHLMPGEVQGCIGCHSDRNSSTPISSSHLRFQAIPQDLETPDWGVKGFSYPEVVQPVLDRHCVQCHNEREQPGEVDLSGDKTDFFNVSYDVLARKGTQGERNWRNHGSPSGRKYDHVRGMSPYTEWIWTINGAGHNIHEIQPRRWGSPASKLAEIIRSGHPDQEGNLRIDVPQADRRKIYLWIDLNVPYYGTSSSSYKERLGSRRMYPYELDTVLKEVASNRCFECHKKEIPRDFFTRMLKPENNSFMLAPLAGSAGGTERCGQAIFKSKDDPDYQRLMAVFQPLKEMLKKTPRADMKGSKIP